MGFINAIAFLPSCRVLEGVSDIILIFPFYSILGLAVGIYLKMKLNAHAKNFKLRYLKKYLKEYMRVRSF